VLTIPGTAAGLAMSVVAPPGAIASLLGVVVGGAVLLLVRWGWRAATGVDGMGLGDVKMLAMIGAFLGWQQVVLVLFLASVAGAVVGLVLVAAKGKSLQSHLPFGTFLSAAAWVAALVGDPVVGAYVNALP
jgi:leader peptidase (prepilin peptidase)/N-methyltransferase